MAYKRNADGTITVALGGPRKAANDPHYGPRPIQ